MRPALLAGQPQPCTHQVTHLGRCAPRSERPQPKQLAQPREVVLDEKGPARVDDVCGRFGGQQAGGGEGGELQGERYATASGLARSELVHVTDT